MYSNDWCSCCLQPTAGCDFWRASRERQAPNFASSRGDTRHLSGDECIFELLPSDTTLPVALSNNLTTSLHSRQRRASISGAEADLSPLLVLHPPRQRRVSFGGAEQPPPPPRTSAPSTPAPAPHLPASLPRPLPLASWRQRPSYRGLLAPASSPACSPRVSILLSLADRPSASRTSRPFSVEP